MPSASYSFLDVVVLDDVRERFAAADALAILSSDLEQVIWANGAGAHLLGYSDIETAMAASARLGAATTRQIASTSGFPNIGRNRTIVVRMATGLSSRMVTFVASSITMPDGELAILLAVPAAGGSDTAKQAIAGFSEAGDFVALLDRRGTVEASSHGFGGLGLSSETLAGLIGRLAAVDGRIVKRVISGARGILPAGLARLTTERYLLVVVDESVSAGVPDALDDKQPGEPEAKQIPLDQMLAAEAPSVEKASEFEPDAVADDASSAAETLDGSAADRTEVRGQPDMLAALEQIVPETPTEIGNEDIAGFGEEPKHEETELVALFPLPELDDLPDPQAGSGVEASDELARTQAAEASADDGRSDAQAIEAPVPDSERAALPVRFVWRTDAEGRFSQISPEFAQAVGAEAADIVGRGFEDVASDFGLDPAGEIAGLLTRRDTWSGRSVLWPVAGTDLKIPVDLAALPVYGRDRNFEGFRGFGVARAGDALVDPDGIGLVLVAGFADALANEAAGDGPARDKPANDARKSVDPFQGEVPALSITPAEDRRFTDKVIRLAEHRTPANDKGLSAVERSAFQQIGERLKRDSEAAKEQARSAANASQPDDAEIALLREAEEFSQDVEDLADLLLSDGASAAELAAHETPAAEPALAPASEVPISPDIDAGRSVDTSEAADDILQAGDDVPVVEPGIEAKHFDADPAPPAEATPNVFDPQPDPVATDADAPERGELVERSVRPGKSLLDLAQWDHEEKDAAIVAPQTGRAATDLGAEAPVENGPATPQADTPVEPAGTEPVAPGAEPAFAAPAAKVPSAPPIDVESPASSRQTFRPRFEVIEHQAAAKRLAAEIVPERHPGDAPPLKVSGFTPSAFSPAYVVRTGGSDLSIIEKLPVPVLVHSGDDLHYANAEFLALTGYASVEELSDAGGIGALFADPYEGEDDPRHDDRQMRLRNRRGEEFPVEAFLQSVRWNEGKALLLVLSRAKEAGSGQPSQSPLNAELEARVAEMRTIIDTATDGVVLMSRDGTIRSISRPAEALFGFDSDEVTGKPFPSLFAIESQRSARDYLNGLSDHGVASVLNDGREVIGREAEGRFIPLFMTIGKLPGESGYCAVVRDITQWKRAEEELTQAKALAERASSHKTDFLARVSHEIRTPLNAIIGFSELMMDERFGPVANDRYRDYLRDINRSGNHVLDLVNDLLDISKIEAGQQDMSYEAVPLNDTLAETVAMMQPQANRERVIIRSSFASKLPDVVADLRSIRQIALNILSNAVRYTQAGGQVIVSTSYETTGDIVMRVRDTGIGMTPQEIEQALKPFKQINSLKRARGDGTGLGLPLTKAMVEANRAKFSINSTPGEGTLVEVTFPSTRVLAE